MAGVSRGRAASVALSGGAIAGCGRLDGKVALVSGGARGMGAAIAARFCAEGAKVVSGDILDDEGAEVARQIGPAASYTHLDVTSEADWEAAVARCLDEFGSIDVLVNNAGVVMLGGVLSTTLAEYRRIIEVNQIGCFLGMKAAAMAMQHQRSGSIVNTSSDAGLIGANGVVAYAASKFAVRGMSRSAALEFGPLGIRVNSVHPGPIDTPMTRAPQFVAAGIDQDAYGKTLPIGRLGRPEDVAALMVFLASDESSFCTGGEFSIDGGSSCGAHH
jgi:3alpha(or 20beta)-hydroxysteroid dehydrogenase